jgi:hypothetical protein
MLSRLTAEEPDNNRMELTALRAAAHTERWAPDRYGEGQVGMTMLKTAANVTLKPLARTQGFITSVFVPLLLGAIGLFYVVKVFGSLTADTTGITNTAFVAIASLAALAFGWARSLLPDDLRQWRIRFGGEQLTQAALQMLCASLLKYTILATGASVRRLSGQSFVERVSRHGVAFEVLDVSVGILIVILFSAAVVSAASGVLSLGRALNERIK